MPLPINGPMSATAINIEASRVGSTTGPLAGTVGTTPTAVSFVGLYANSTPVFPPMNTSPSYKYSDFYGRTFVAATSPWWIINTTYAPGLNGKKYTTSGSNVVPNNSDPLSTSVILGPLAPGVSQSNGQWNACGILTINSDEDMIIVGGSYSTSTNRYYPVWQQYLRSFYTSSITNSFRGMSDNGHFIDYPGSINHVAADAIYLQGDETKIFWLDQEFATTGDDGAVDIRRYGIFSINTSTYSGDTYPKLWQYTGWTRQINDSTHQQGYHYSQPRATSLSNEFINQWDDTSVLDEDIINIYVVNQIKNENLANDREWNGGITKMKYDKTTSTGTSVALTTPTFKVWQINRGVGTGTGSNMPNSNTTGFNDITFFGAFDPR